MTNEGLNGLPAHLVSKRAAMAATAGARPAGATWREQVWTDVEVDDASGVRKLRIRDWRLFSTGGRDIGDFELGPMSPELFCASLAGCLTQIIMIRAAQRGLTLERVHVRFEADVNDASFFGLSTNDAAGPCNLQSTVSLDAPAVPEETLRALVLEADALCGLLEVVRRPQAVRLVVADVAEPRGATGLPVYLARKRAAMRDTAARRPDGGSWRERLRSEVTADDASGVRKVSIREWRLLQNGRPEIGDFGLAPMPTEMFLGCVASCLAHIILILAAERALDVEYVHVRAQAENNDASYFGVPTSDPRGPFDLQLTATVDAPTLSPAARRQLVEDAEARCGILAVLRGSTEVRLAFAGQ